MSRRPFPFFQFPSRPRAVIARDVDVELDFHVEMRVQDLMAEGMTPDDARRRAREEFGDMEFTRRYCRRIDEQMDRTARAVDRWSEWRQDTRYAWRSVRRSTAFAAVAVLTLALAIGANTAIFSVARAVLLRPLPYGNPGALVALFETWQGNAGDPIPLSPPNYLDYQAEQRSLSALAAYQGLGSVVWQPQAADPEMISGVAVSANLFSVLQAKAQLGQTFRAGDDAPGRPTKAIVSYAFWQRALGADTAVIGRRLTLNGQASEIVGVMPRTFTLGLEEDVWMTLDLSGSVGTSVSSRKQHYLRAIGRLKPGVSLEAAAADFKSIGRALAQQFPDANTDRFAEPRRLHDVMIGNLRPAVLMLQGAALLVLLIACANLANLTLARTMSRRREIAVRAALGAARIRLIRQLLTESVLLALVGGALGVALAFGVTRALLGLNPDTLPGIFEVSIDTRVLWFSLGLSVTTGVLFGLVPALDAGRANVHDALKEAGRGTSGGRGGERLRHSLVVAQVGLAVTLLVGAGLLMRSFHELTRVKPGFDSQNVLTAELRAAGARYDASAAVNQFYDNVIEAVAATPGVVAVGATNKAPTRGRLYSTLRVDGQPVDEAHLPDIGYVSVRGDYFRALRIPLLAGRAYDATDLPDGPKTIVINEAAARRFFPKGDAVGHRIRIGPDPNGAPMRIIGVVGDIRDEGLGTPAKPTLFANHRQEAWERTMTLVVRTMGSPASATTALRRAVRAQDPALAIRNIETLSDVVASSFRERRFSLGLATAFSLVALTLAAIGIYGVLSYSVTSRSREFGVRMALGASANNVLLLVMRQGLGWSLLGVALGVALAAAGSRLLSGMLYGVRPLDAPTYAFVIVGLLLVVVLACLIPASRATRTDPLTTMRAE